MPEEHLSPGGTVLSPGWSRPKPEVLAAPSWWPALLSLGASVMVWGLVTSFVVLLIGLITFVVSLTGWIGDLRHEHNEH